MIKWSNCKTSVECSCVHGKCNSGPDGDGECYCQPPFSGPKCDKGKLGTIPVSLSTDGSINIIMLIHT